MSLSCSCWLLFASLLFGSSLLVAMSQDPGDALMDLETDLVDIGNSDGEEIGEDDKAAPKSIKESKGKRKGNSAASEAGSLISTKKGVNKDLLGVKKATENARAAVFTSSQKAWAARVLFASRTSAALIP